MAKQVTGSPIGALDGTDIKKIVKGAAIAFGGAALYSIASWLAAGEVDWDTFLRVCIPAALSVGINAVWKFFQDNSP